MENHIPPNQQKQPELPSSPVRSSHISKITTIVILIVALLAAAYLYAISLQSRYAQTTNLPHGVSSSTETTASLEADLNKINVDTSDQGSNAIDSSFKP